MSSADNRGHWLTRFTIAYLAACGGGAPTGERLPADLGAATARVQALAISCTGLTHALDAITTSAISGRPLLALVDAVQTAARCAEPLPATRGATSARLLAHARYMGSDARAVDQLPSGTVEPALALRRGEMLDELHRPADARRELALVLALAPDAAALAQFQLLTVAAAAQRSDLAALSALIAAAPIADRPRLAHRAAREVRDELLYALPDGGPELALAACERLEEIGGAAKAIGPRERLVELTPDDADAWDALARSRLAKHRLEGALEAWDRAIAIAPAQPAFRTAPIQALVLAADPRARTRVDALAREARGANDVELLVVASAGAALVDHALATALAQDAQRLRPTDGRLAFLVAQRLAESGNTAAAGRAYAILLICGAHGRPWHRHEVAAKLQELGADGRVALDGELSCEPVEPADLATYTTTLRAIH